MKQIVECEGHTEWRIGRVDQRTVGCDGRMDRFARYVVLSGGDFSQASGSVPLSPVSIEGEGK